MVSSAQNNRAEPRWPAILAMIAVVGLRFARPPALRVGTDWLLAPVVATLLVLASVLHKKGKNRANQILGYILLATVTADMIASLSLLITRLPAHRETPRELLTAAIGIWSSNVLVFASWYWRLDGGGPNARDRRKSHDSGASCSPRCKCGIKPGSPDLWITSFWPSIPAPRFRQPMCRCFHTGRR
jgi:hypothetical protein